MQGRWVKGCLSSLSVTPRAALSRARDVREGTRPLDLLFPSSGGFCSCMKGRMIRQAPRTVRESSGTVIARSPETDSISMHYTKHCASQRR